MKTNTRTKVQSLSKATYNISKRLELIRVEIPGTAELSDLDTYLKRSARELAYLSELLKKADLPLAAREQNLSVQDYQRFASTQTAWETAKGLRGYAGSPAEKEAHSK
jgi:hypothetical protein